ncbi:MAG: enoyl-CoA hydratase/isomerase family protein [Deltaproteobacteria bacterium]|nr:enoyl-CoA hydratase/isomerase family protein [Deltaproteobacteria bacterium]
MSVLCDIEGPVARITIARAKALNAIDASVLEGLDAAIDRVLAHAGVAAVVVTGEGDRAFVAGADIAAMAGLSATEAERFAGRGQRVLDRLAALPMPVLAAVNGFALGGGCELAMACDLIFAGPKAKFGQPEVKLGVIPGFGGTQRLVRRVGWSNALDLCLTGRVIDAAEAKAMGLVSRIADDVVAEATKVATEMAALGPVALRLCKRAIHEGADAALPVALAAERTLFGLCFATADQKEGMAAFLEKRAARFEGR